MNNNEAFYTPGGYRYIHQIVLEIPEEALKAACTEQVAMNRAAQSMAAALRYDQMEKLNNLIDGWQADYEIETHPELLKY